MPNEFDPPPPGDWHCPSCGSVIKDGLVDQPKEGLTILTCDRCMFKCEVHEVVQIP